MSEAVAIVVVVACLVSAGLASGLTQGLLSLDHLELSIKTRSGTPIEKKQAAALLPIIENHHLLLVTLMLWNASAMEILPLFLDELVPTAVAIILSVTLILLVGEIGPAAVMTGPQQLTIAYNLTYLVYGVMILFFPIAYPVSKLLDCMLGVDDQVTTYNRAQLSEMVKIQHEERVRRGSKTQEGVNHEEITMIDGVLKFNDVVVRDIMTTEMFMLSMNDKLNLQTLNRIFRAGFSRIPIYELDENDLVGILLAKDLLFIDPDDEIPIRSFMNLFSRPLQVVWPDQKLGEVLKMFRQSHGHMAIVRDVVTSGNLDPTYKVIGLLTLEDIFERILGNEIMDETDTLDENQVVVKNRNRDVELMRMSMLNPSLLGLNQHQHLTSEEAKVITSFLMANVPQVKLLIGDDAFAVEEFVKKSVVVEMKKVEGNSKLLPENLLYKRGKISNMCILVLSGKIDVVVGKDEFKSEVGPWMTLGQSTLVLENDEYVPDFSAYVASSDLRYLRLTKPSSNPDSQTTNRFQKATMASQYHQQQHQSHHPPKTTPIISSKHSTAATVATSTRATTALVEQQEQKEEQPSHEEKFGVGPDENDLEMQRFHFP